jgi:hypothetical protein
MRYEKVFTPGAPIMVRHFLFGRDQELSDLKNYLNRAGLHPIVIGNRGVGKTSVVIQSLANISPPPIRINCIPGLTFPRLAMEILRKLDVSINEIESSKEISTSLNGKASPFRIGIEASSEIKTIHKEQGPASQSYDALSVFEYLRVRGDKRVIVLDEYDAVSSGSQEFHSSIAYLIKLLSDHANECEVRLIIVGVAQSSKDLLGKHESIERSAREIYLNPLRHQDILLFLNEAETRLRIKFEQKIKDEISRDSAGYPYYAHLVGLECVDAMRIRDKRSRQITESDYTLAINRAIKHAFRSELRKYQSAIRGITEKEWLVIKELANMGPRPPRKELQNSISKRNIMTPEEFDHSWVKL